MWTNQVPSRRLACPAGGAPHNRALHITCLMLTQHKARTRPSAKRPPSHLSLGEAGPLALVPPRSGSDVGVLPGLPPGLPLDSGAHLRYLRAFLSDGWGGLARSRRRVPSPPPSQAPPSVTQARFRKTKFPSCPRRRSREIRQSPSPAGRDLWRSEPAKPLSQ